MVPWPSLRTVGSLPTMDLYGLLGLAHDLATRLLITVLAAMTS